MSAVGHNGWRQADRALAFFVRCFLARSIKVKVSGTRRGLAVTIRNPICKPGEFLNVGV